MGQARKHDHANLGGSNRLLTFEEAAAILSTTVHSLQCHYGRWGIPVVRRGRSVRFRERDLLIHIERSVDDGSARAS